MKKPHRRRSAQDLPHAPLLMLHPLAVPGAVPPGRDIVREVRVPEGSILYSLHWMVLSWSYDRKAEQRGDPQAWEQIEREMLSHPDERLGQPCGLLAGFVARPRELLEEEEEVARACIAISDWALERDFRMTGADFAKVAALAWPRNPRYACIAGGILLSVEQIREAEWWFQRAHRLAIWTHDRECQVRALIGWADTAERRCGADYAAELYRRAIRQAEHYALTDLEGEAEARLQAVQRTHERADTNVER